MPTAKKTHPELVKKTQNIECAARLARLGARPPTIQGLLPYLAMTTIKNIYEEVTGSRSPRGPTSYTLHTHFSSPLNRIKSTYALVTFLQYRAAGVHDIDAIIATYTRYNQIFGDQQESKGVKIDHIWHLVRSYLVVGDVKLSVCPECGHLHITDPAELPLQINCPLRKVIGSNLQNYLPSKIKKAKHRNVDAPPMPHIDHTSSDLFKRVIHQKRDN